jgi:hypothetical protein
MELTWIMKLRIAAAAAIGVVLVGIVAWPWDNPPDPYGSIVVLAIDKNGAVTLAFMALLAGLFAYFVTWPYGREIGKLAVPFGLILWAVKAGSTSYLMQKIKPGDFEQRRHILSMLQWEPLFWLAIVAIGFAGVALGERVRPSLKLQYEKVSQDTKYGRYFNIIMAVVVSFAVVHLGIKILAKDVILSDKLSGTVFAQPAIGQVVFAIFVSFGFAAFIVKKIFDVNYYWTIAASFFVTAFSTITYTKGQLLEHLADLWPGSYFPDVIISILPVQMVTFGTLGAITGYWMAIRYQFHKQPQHSR